MTEARFEIALKFRPCVEDDLPALEWMGLHTPEREIIERAFAEQERGEALMLLGVAGGFPVAQAWIDFSRRGSAKCPHLWAVRVFPPLSGAGIGRALLREAERRVARRGAQLVELGVEPGNKRARRFYHRLGYRDAADAPSPSDGPAQLVLRKPLHPPRAGSEPRR